MSKIFTLSEASSIAIHSMVLILTSKDRINANHIAEKVGASRHHVSKVLQRLVKEGFLTSNRGPLGGFAIKKKPGEISFYDIYKSIEGNIEDNEYIKDDKIILDDKCIFCGFEKRITSEFKEYLTSTTLQSYYEQKNMENSKLPESRNRKS